MARQQRGDTVWDTSPNARIGGNWGEYIIFLYNTCWWAILALRRPLWVANWGPSLDWFFNKCLSWCVSRTYWHIDSYFATPQQCVPCHDEWYLYSGKVGFQVLVFVIILADKSMQLRCGGKWGRSNCRPQHWGNRRLTCMSSSWFQQPSSYI